MIRIQREDFSVEAVLAAMGRGEVGAIVTFVGTVRDLTGDRPVTAMELEHYPGMTESELEKIEAAARARFSVRDIRVVHRVGRLSPLDRIVLVAVASAHRAEAFDACRFVIDHLKIQATFWKKEFSGQGERWVDTCPGCEAAASGWADLAQVSHNHAAAKVEAPHHHHDPRQSLWTGLRVGILTLSDSRSRQNDGSGDALEGLARAAGGDVAAREILPDNAQEIQACLVAWADDKRVDIILTTGGTGPGPRDVTPEATRAVCDRELPGVSEWIRAEGMKKTRRACLSRGITAFRGMTLVINLPGSVKGAAEGFEAIVDLAPHALAMARGGGH